MDDRWESEVIEYGAINITGFRIIDTSRRYVKDFLEGWRRLDPATSHGAGRESISAQAALMYDAVFVLVEAFNKLLRKKPDLFRNNFRRGLIFNNGSRGLDCNTSGGWVTPWEHGDKISRFLRKVSSNYNHKRQKLITYSSNILKQSTYLLSFYASQVLPLTYNTHKKCKI